MRLFVTLCFFCISVFGQENLKDFLDFKYLERSNIISKNPKLKSMMYSNDLASDLVDIPNQMIYSVKEMENQKLTTVYLDLAPWSDYYWPIYQGILGHRYNDRYTRFESWKDNFDLFVKNSTSELVLQKRFEEMAPAEKYDYVFETKKNTLTDSCWDEGKKYQDQYGNVEKWMGICHGWAAAAIMMDTPKKEVEVKALSGQAVTFNPADVKAFGSLLWANGDFETKSIGGRCNIKNPKRDDQNRSINQECLDTNPGTWHLAIVNQLGLFKRSFVMDVAFDYEVWNQPVYSYSYSYFNPDTDVEGDNLLEAIVDVKKFSSDLRKKYRNPKAIYILGIKMNVSYVTETYPEVGEHLENAFQSLELKYDLELDANYRIIGGEWHSEKHPDFLWVPVLNSFPHTYGSHEHKKIDLGNLPKNLNNIIERNSAQGVPFSPFVKALFEESAKE